MYLELRGDLPQALDAYAALRGDLTTDLGSQLGQGRVLVKLGRPADALPFLDRHMQREPWSVEGRRWRGRAHAMSGRFGAADAEYAKAIAADRDHVAALHDWADALGKAGRPNDAKARLALAAEAEKRLAIPIEIPPSRKP